MDWVECNKKRVVKRVSVDESLINSLIKSSKNKFDSGRKLELDEITSSSKISLMYDSLRELLEALALKNKYKIYNHNCFTAFLKERLNEFLIAEEFDEIRKIRNSINYYGKEIDLFNTRRVILRIKQLRKKIGDLLN